MSDPPHCLPRDMRLVGHSCTHLLLQTGVHHSTKDEVALSIHQLVHSLCSCVHLQHRPLLSLPATASIRSRQLLNCSTLKASTRSLDTVQYSSAAESWSISPDAWLRLPQRCQTSKIAIARTAAQGAAGRYLPKREVWRPRDVPHDARWPARCQRPAGGRRWLPGQHPWHSWAVHHVRMCLPLPHESS